MMTRKTEEKYSTISIKVETPDGRMFVHILENGQDLLPIMVLINIGKTGSNLAAWAEATARLATALIQEKGLYGAISELSGITSADYRRTQRGEVIRSGPEGVAYALMRYKDERFKRNRPKHKEGGASTEKEF